jgi:hypothetical protein
VGSQGEREVEEMNIYEMNGMVLLPGEAREIQEEGVVILGR